MAAIKRRDTKPEIQIRSALHAQGFRFRLDARDLPGSPDLLLPKYRAAIFVNGCFWHRHECSLFKWPASEEDYWREKLNKNAARDQRNLHDLFSAEWRVAIIWECALRGKKKRDFSALLSELVEWIVSDRPMLELGSMV